MSLRQNVVANYLGQGWVAFINIAFIPFYIEYLGMEAYGLIGVFAILQAWLALLDFGMSPTINREVARYSAGERDGHFIRTIFRSLEAICLFIAIIVGLGVGFVAPWLAEYWIKAEAIRFSALIDAISLMGCVIALRIPEGLYRGVLLGLQKHILFNISIIVLTTLRCAGVLAVLKWWSPTITAFFLWQFAISLISTLIMGYLAYKYLPKIRVVFSISAIKEVWQFSKGIFLTTALSLVLLQSDKIILSKTLSLETFGYYAFATSVSGLLYLLALPIAQSFSPKFSQQVASGDFESLSNSYHQAAQLGTAVVMPVALLIVFFARPIIFVWTGNAELSNATSEIIIFLSIGCALNTLMYVPYMVQFAYGWVSFSVMANLFAVAIFIPILLFIVPIFGPEGAAATWAGLNILYLLITAHFMYSKILIGERKAWYLNDLLMPTLTALVPIIISLLLHRYSLSRTEEFAWLLATVIVAWLASIRFSNKLWPIFLMWLKANTMQVSFRK